MATKNSNNRTVPFAHIPIHMALKAAIELHVFDILAKSGPIGTQLTATQIASEIPTTNPKQAATSLHRILRFLSFHSFLTTSLPPGSSKEEDRLFGLTTLTASSMVRKDGRALPSIGLSVLIHSEIEILQAFDNLKDAVLDPDGAKYPFEMAHGEGFYDYLARRPDSRLNMFFNQLMGNSSKLFFNDVIRVYKGFEEVIELMDVGGNEGLALETIISLYPNIKNCINFDLPHVIARAPILKGVKHVAGDMFETLPNSKTIILKWILHNWSDDKCVKLLQNCWRALPEEGGKVIVLEMVIPNDCGWNPETTAVDLDLGMLALSSGRERTISEFQNLAMDAGFHHVHLIPTENEIQVLEFLKCNLGIK